jgi:hypothetical protein
MAPSDRAYSGEMGADVWARWARWTEQVAVKWAKTVQLSVSSVRKEAGRQAVKGRRPAGVLKTASMGAGHSTRQGWRVSPELAPGGGRALGPLGIPWRIGIQLVRRSG